MVEVIPVAQARSELSKILNTFRSDDDAPDVIVGSHRRPEAVIIPYPRFQASRSRGEVSLSRLRQLAPVIQTLAEASRLGDVKVFGSVARGDQTAVSDVDLLATPGPGSTLFDIAQFEQELKLILGAAVTVVPITSLHPERDAAVLREAIAL